MFYNKVVNLPTAGTAYLIRTLLVALDPNAPVVLATGKIKVPTNSPGSIAIGDAAMTSVADGDEILPSEFSEFGGTTGIALDTSSRYLIGSANNCKALIQGTTF